MFTLVAMTTALLALAGGCAKTCPPLKPGTSGVELHVVAEPKNGVQMPTSDDYSGVGDPGAIFPRVPRRQTRILRFRGFRCADTVHQFLNDLRRRFHRIQRQRHLR